MVLKGIPPCLTPDLLHILASMVKKKMAVNVKGCGNGHVFPLFFLQHCMFSTPNMFLHYECVTPGPRRPDCSCRYKLPLSVNMRRGCGRATPGKDLLKANIHLPHQVRADGHSIPVLLEAILQLLPLDTYVYAPVWFYFLGKSHTMWRRRFYFHKLINAMLWYHHRKGPLLGTGSPKGPFQ